MKKGDIIVAGLEHPVSKLYYHVIGEVEMIGGTILFLVKGTALRLSNFKMDEYVNKWVASIEVKNCRMATTKEKENYSKASTI